MNEALHEPTAKPPIPESARGLCWGGFFLNWIWAIGNRTWIGLLTLVPFIGLLMPFVLLFKGREWAWNNNDWKSVEHFNSNQRTWSLVGVLLIVIGVFGAGFIAAVAIPNFVRYQEKAMQSEAKMYLYSIYAAEMGGHADSETFSADLNSFAASGLDLSGAKHYRFGFADSGPEFAQHCPDCTAGKDAFKVVAIGEIHSKTDVWTIDHKRNLVHVTEDR